MCHVGSLPVLSSKVKEKGKRKKKKDGDDGMCYAVYQYSQVITKCVRRQTMRLHTSSSRCFIIIMTQRRFVTQTSSRSQTVFHSLHERCSYPFTFTDYFLILVVLHMESQEKDGKNADAQAALVSSHAQTRLTYTPLFPPISSHPHFTTFMLTFIYAALP